VNGSLDGVKLHRVDSLDALDACRAWAAERRDGPLCADTESGGLSPYHHRMRLVQLGDKRHGWAFPPGWAGAAAEIMRNAPWLGFHNRPYDARVLKRHAGFQVPWERAEDTLPAGHICDSLKLAGLKPRAAIEVDPRAVKGEQILHDGMARNGWTWDTVPDDWEPYWAYSALDPVLTAHLWGKFAPEVTGRYREAYDLEKATTRISAAMMDAGLAVDIPFIEDAMRRVSAYHARAMAYLSAVHGIRTVNSGAQVMAGLNRAGIPTQVWTATGEPAISKDALAFYKANYPQHRDLIQCVQWARKAGDINGKYLQKFLDLHVDGIMHYSINTCRARTSRMCLPESQQLLTRRGILPVDDVREGDETIDASGSWTRVLAVHRYPDQETVKYAHRHARLEATAEHRWLLSPEKRPSARRLEPITALRRNLHLNPWHPSFDFDAREVPLDGTEAVQFAAIVGWLVSDGRCIDDGYGKGLKSIIYQTERKFYKEVLRCLPVDSIMYMSQGGENCPDMHEIGLRARWLHPRLEAAGLRADPLLRTSRSLLPWVLSLSLPELRAFFSAVWLADGSTAHPQNKHISCESEPLRDALQYCGYVLGLRSRVTEDAPGGWSTGPRMGVKFTSRPVTTRFLERSPGRADVWCVTTDSGTFTAWGQGPYLTGNSVTDPPMQTFDRDEPVIRGSFVPRPGHVLISVDADQMEMRETAHFSGDANLINDFLEADASGQSFFVLAASRIYGQEIAKSDPRYSWTKNASYAQVYGSGLENAAVTAGVPVEQMRPVYYGFQQRYPGVPALMNRLIRQGKSGGRPYAKTIDGRKLYVRRGHEYAILNTMCQGSGAVILKRGLVDLDAAGLGGYLRLTLHDEYLFECPKEDAEDVLRKAEQILTNKTDFAVPLTWSGKILPHRWQKV